MPKAKEPTSPDSTPKLSDNIKEHLLYVIESLVFVSDVPITMDRLIKISGAKKTQIQDMIETLEAHYKGRGIELHFVQGGYQFRSAARNAPFVRELVAPKPVKLSRAQLETLAIIAYRQPLTRPEAEEIRGVDSGSALKTLLERDLIKIIGRKEEPGRPLLYGTSKDFLQFFGLGSLNDLPTLREFTELSDESKSLFSRRTGEAIESIGQIEIQSLSEDELNEGAVSDEELMAFVNEHSANEQSSSENTPDESSVV